MGGTKGSRKKNGLFTVRLTVRGGGGGSAPSALTVSKCENFGPIVPIIKWLNKSKYDRKKTVLFLTTSLTIMTREISSV